MLNLRTISKLKDHPVLKSTAILVVITLGVRGVGYVEKLVLAYYYGTGPEVDAYLVVVGLILSLFVLVRELVEPGFMAVFTGLREAGDEEEGWRFFNQLAACILLLLIGITVVGMFFPEAVIQFSAPGFKGAKRNLAIDILRIAFPAIIFLSLSALTNIALNAKKQFALPASGDLARKVLGLVCLVILFDTFGIKAAAIGLIVGALGKISVHLIGLRKQLRFSRPTLKSSHFKKMWQLTWPLLIGMLFSQASGLVDNMFASFQQDGALSALNYAKKLAEFPVLIFPYLIGIVVFPYFSELNLKKDKSSLRSLLSGSLEWIWLVFVPLSVFVFLYHQPLVEIAFQRGAFDEESTQLTMVPLAVYAIGMTAFAIESVLVLFYFACSDTKTPIFVGMGCVILNILLTWGGIHFFGYVAIAGALVVSKTIKVFILLGLLPRKIEINRSAVFRFTWKSLVALIPAGGIMFLLHRVAGWWLPDSTLGKLVDAGLAFGIGLTVFLLACWLLGIRFRLRGNLEEGGN